MGKQGKKNQPQKKVFKTKQFIVKRNQQVENLIEKYVKSKVVPFIKENTDEDEKNLFEREYKRISTRGIEI